MPNNLIIVESPAKAKTIGKYLGRDFTVKATMGHLRDLPKSKMGVDIPGFIIDYRPIAGKEKTISDLRAQARAADHVYLATDPDREGEAISWHLKELLELSDDKTARVTFNEITKKVVQDSIKHPRAIDDHLVDAQQARRVLDRIVGYELSPLLWRKVRPGLSAGRVQSVAVRLVVDREEEVRAFIPKEYWSIDVTLARREGPGKFDAHFHGTPAGKAELGSQAEADAVVAAVTGAPFSVSEVKTGQRKRTPAPPFITSTLQQEASRKLNMNPRRAMAVAQQLYEGVEIGDLGLTGLITYMRTDSQRLSEEALDQVRVFIKDQYGPAYCPAAPRRYKGKKEAQDAHEAIRPSDVTLTPDKIRDSLADDQYKLYKLIWSRFVACQMENALYDTLTIDTLSAGYIFRANHTSLKFAGFTAVYEEGRDDEKEERDDPLPDLRQGELLSLTAPRPAQHFTQPPPRFTEASLIKAMEEQGIGRPSTYAPTISTILEREYILRQNKALSPTPLGEVVTTMMKEKFQDIIDVAFTARMENNLDEVEEGRKDWRAMLADFYGGFSEAVKQAAEDKTRYKVPDEPTDFVCELCGRNMVIKMGRFGRFVACPGYPECKNTKPISEPTPGECPKCGAVVLKKKSRNNRDYYGCEKFPACDFMTWDVPIGDRCPECSRTLFKRGGRGATKPFCANPQCPAYLPEDQRGYRRKKTETAEAGAGTGTGTEAPAAKRTGKPAVRKTTAARSTATKKPAAKTTAATVKKAAAPKKTTTAKAAPKKAATAKPAAKKTTAAKTTVKKTTAAKKATTAK
ncbi:MAG: type I DNA topoisomerase [Oscillospiraceae bacterium]|jgi:DNA topoisomerase-1|nr:type I DNA topoisomerase [Oscillospiraceae bacterium]